MLLLLLLLTVLTTRVNYILRRVPKRRNRQGALDTLPNHGRGHFTIDSVRFVAPSVLSGRSRAIDFKTVSTGVFLEL